MDATIIIKFTAKNICDEKDLEHSGMSFRELVKETIYQEGLFGIVEDEWEYLLIENGE